MNTRQLQAQWFMNQAGHSKAAAPAWTNKRVEINHGSGDLFLTFLADLTVKSHGGMAEMGLEEAYRTVGSFWPKMVAPTMKPIGQAKFKEPSITASKGGVFGAKLVVRVKVQDIMPLRRGEGDKGNFNPAEDETYADDLIEWLARNGWKPSA